MACIIARMERFRVATPKGSVTAVWHDAGASGGRGAAPALVVAHGAGAALDHPFIAGFCSALRELGVSALRFNFPYMEAGRKSPDRPADAVAAFVAAVDEARRRSGGAVFGGGKSYGGRMASVAVAEGLSLSGLVFLGYPLHAPGRSDKPRDEHLYRLRIPMLFLQGTRDPFADPDVLASVLKRLGKRAVYVPFEGAGHSFELSRRDDAGVLGASLAPHVAAFIREHL